MVACDDFLTGIGNIELRTPIETEEAEIENKTSKNRKLQAI